MDHAIQAAMRAAEAGEVPVGAIITHQSKIIVTAQNQMRELKDATAHAEILAIRTAMEKLGAERLNACDLYVTLEPCTMCTGAIAHARLRRVYYGAADKKGGAVENGVQFFEHGSCHHRPEIISGIGAQKCSALLKDFFASRR